MPTDTQQRARDIAFFVALMATALALGGALAHALELPNKIAMPRADYFVVQRIYDGWNQLAYLLAVQATGILAVVLLHWREPRVLWPAATALTTLAAAQAVFWIWTFPANVATDQWTSQPENWETLRRQWEYSHLTGAAFQVIVMAALVVAVMRRGRAVDLGMRPRPAVPLVDRGVSLSDSDSHGSD